MRADDAILGLHLNADLMQQVLMLAQEFGDPSQCAYLRNAALIRPPDPEGQPWACNSWTEVHQAD
jgi:hypothetical protein